ncbi:PaaX family transcriptional regulator C-terminal domain-containing protein [Fredinandcohnia sp. QZ13]|uniref:PaaX family transcriptional regulator n=1 Tax=Fredinandcohnia sp. QZ13 TaxID=3073144 RepID=UPI002853689F|nr:PaaX family transcriptional regulator C-terminal domain-containing protein [Fredinandcohnia sp. QZ13]MDR4887666.1 PaaX family transcriptional regulator C-terminal domain-containing protein [Fredinandcohnia sp. QZ13]
MKPRSLMFTLYGEYIKYYGGEIWVGSLIELMKQFGVSESSVRGAIFRMVQNNLLEVRKVGKKSYYSATSQGRVDEGVSRVYATQNHMWDQKWRILTYSFPEEKREIRNKIRKELIWTGFGNLTNSTLVTPNPVEDQVKEMIRVYGIEEYAFLFTSSSIVTHDNQSIIDIGWDLNMVSDEYQTFIDKFTPKFEELREKALNNTLKDEECFIERTVLVHEYRKFLFQDPGFPRDLLPEGWIGIKARELFWNIHQLLSIPSIRYFESVFEEAPDREIQVERDKALNPFGEIYI